MKYIIISLSIVFFYSCGTGIHVMNFKNTKKKIDTLVLLPVDISIKSIDHRKNMHDDFLLANDIQEKVSKQTIDLLGSKYHIKYDSHNVDSLMVFDIVDSLHRELNSENISIEHIPIPKSLQRVLEKHDNQYFLLILFKAQYSLLEGYTAYNKSVVYIDPLIINKIKGYAVMFDKLENKTLYIKKVSSKADVRQYVAIKQNVMSLLKMIYYK